MYLPTLTREAYIRKGSNPVTREGVDGIVYTYEVGAKPLAMAFIGKQSKPAWHYSFRNDAARTEKIEEFFTNLQGHQDWKAKQYAAAGSPNGCTTWIGAGCKRRTAIEHNLNILRFHRLGY